MLPPAKWLPSGQTSGLDLNRVRPVINRTYALTRRGMSPPAGQKHGSTMLPQANRASIGWNVRFACSPR